MPQLKEELQRVKPLPLIKRSWLYVKDHPSTSAVTLAKVLNEKASSVSSALCALFDRGMATREADKTKRGVVLYLYSVPRTFDKYELLPFRPDAREKKNRIRPHSVTHLPVPAPKVAKPEPEPAPVPAPAPGVWDRCGIDKLTIGEARELHDLLNKLFK